VRVPALRPLRLFWTSPVGAAGCSAVGFANAACWAFLPVYANDQHLSRGLVAGFMSAFTLGGALIQLPLGRVSDRLDRRLIIAATSFCAAGMGVAMFLFGRSSNSAALALIALFGMSALPIYGLSVAHANDKVPRKDFVETSATLLLVNALASTVGPLLAAVVSDHFGISSLFLYTAFVHLTLAAFTVARIGTAAPSVRRDLYEPTPQQSSPAAFEIDPRGGQQQTPIRAS
jgi:MFS family permease